jgi:hypothetical protein
MTRSNRFPGTMMGWRLRIVPGLPIPNTESRQVPFREDQGHCALGAVTPVAIPRGARRRPTRGS